ncbi:unnamed protein product [Anisakis simplex]|uniref:Uncharacterized protein n=1 Tax=Anisakis simplex TaxID=6269 RepID=A0A0M3JDF5_ANISI|nr:unnamed protein product [Anisakis simplex]
MRLDSDVSARLLEVGFGGCAAPRGYLDSRPPLLWSLYYDLNEPVFNADDLPSNLRVVDGVDSSLTYNKLIDNVNFIYFLSNHQFSRSFTVTMKSIFDPNVFVCMDINMELATVT